MSTYQDDKRITHATLKQFNQLVEEALTHDIPVFHSEAPKILDKARIMASNKKKSSRV